MDATEGEALSLAMFDEAGALEDSGWTEAVDEAAAEMDAAEGQAYEREAAEEAAAERLYGSEAYWTRQREAADYERELDARDSLA